MIPPKVLTGICVMVAAVWATSMAFDIISPTYEPDPGINAIFGGTIGTALTLGRKDEKEQRANGRRR